ncbi:hypothetical protein ACSX1A_03325 [Pontibacter sp. MBLB2868]|uniref:hypothetical protein n=1 Tax=Pontibacter sp. MBLB2868 TaxID=3451555 RepID=UPI003F75099B
MAGTVEKEKNEADKETPDAAKLNQLSTRKAEQIKVAASRLILAAGGRASVKSGRSSTVGKAGRRGASRLASFFSIVGTGGVAAAISNVNLPLANLAGLSVDEIIQKVILYCSDGSTGMDETAANAACNHLMQQLAEQAATPEAFEVAIQEAITDKGVEFLLCEYFGFYIFEHLSQRFQEKITQARGQAVSAATFNEIKLDIVGRVHVIGASRPVSSINWQSSQGQQIIDDIFDSILGIFE